MFSNIRKPTDFFKRFDEVRGDKDTVIDGIERSQQGGERVEPISTSVNGEGTEG